MTTLSIDIETYSSVDLKKSGVYKYVESPDFEVLLVAYSFDGEKPKVLDVYLESEIDDWHDAPEFFKVLEALRDETVTKKAFNANFERTCLSKYFGIELPADEWECTMVKAAQLGLPMSLDAAAKALQLEQEKMAEGKALIKYFCTPCKPTKVNGQRTRNLPHHDLEKWATFKQYCAGDVIVEMAISDKLSAFTVPDSEKDLWALDQRINDNGILIDKSFAENAIHISEENNVKLMEHAVKLTGLNNPNSGTQLREWLSKAMEEEVATLRKADVPVLLSKTDDETVRKVLSIRQELAKTSVKKYQAMLNAICEDSRVRGLLQFCGAGRTWRWAGRLVQVQNLPQNHLTDLDLARQLVADGDGDNLDMAFGSVPDTLSQLIRTAFVAGEGNRFLVADFSAIEARVIAWLAGEKWRLEVFKTHGKIYEASASQMFKVPIESIKKGSDLRQKGKVAELALGYQGGPSALETMGALKMGIPQDELPVLVRMWRNANKAIVAYWKQVENAAVECIETGTPISIHHGIKFFTKQGVLMIRLPSGRCLAYQSPALKEGKFGMQLTYMGMDQTTKKWVRMDTYGGKLVENIVQAVARDCLAYAMLQLDAAGYKIAMHVHDEVVLEVPDGFGSLEEVNNIMGQTIPWAIGLPLKADSYETKYYKKD